MMLSDKVDIRRQMNGREMGERGYAIEEVPRVEPRSRRGEEPATNSAVPETSSRLKFSPHKLELCWVFLNPTGLY